MDQQQSVTELVAELAQVGIVLARDTNPLTFTERLRAAVRALAALKEAEEAAHLHGRHEPLHPAKTVAMSIGESMTAAEMASQAGGYLDAYHRQQEEAKERRAEEIAQQQLEAFGFGIHGRPKTKHGRIVATTD